LLIIWDRYQAEGKRIVDVGIVVFSQSPDLKTYFVPSGVVISQPSVASQVLTILRSVYG
jgi:hypothetical protein